MPERFQVSTREHTVEVHFGAREVTRGDVFLHGAVATHAGEETVLDVLNAPAAFFPLRVDSPASRTILVAKAQVRYVRVPRPARPPASSPDLGSELTLEVLSSDGELLVGSVVAELPPAQQRTLDFVNSAWSGFFVLAQPEHDLFINRAHVRHVTDVTDSADASDVSDVFQPAIKV